MDARHSVAVGFCLTSLAALGCSSKNSDNLFPGMSSAGASSGGAASGGNSSAGASVGGASTAGGTSTAGTSPGGDGAGGSSGAASGGASGTSPGGASGTSPGGASGTSPGGASGGGAGGASGAGGSTAGTGGSSAGAAGMAGMAPTDGCNAMNWPPGGTSAPQSLDVTDSKGAVLSRQFYISLPTGYDPSKAYPLVTVWHYAGGTALQMANSGFGGAFYGVQKGFPNAIYVAGQGLTSNVQGMMQTGWPNTNGQDVAFAKAMLAWLEQNYCIDKNRIMSTGMSYGGIMSNTLGCQMPDVFRAVGVMSGALFNFGSGSGCVNHPIAAWLTHGTEDMTVTFASGETARDQYLKDNGCSTTADPTPVEPSPCVAYQGCTSGYPVVWCPVQGEGHTIPSFAAGAIANFFKQF